MVVFLQCTLKEKLPIFLINTLLLHIPLLALTDGQNDGQRNKYTCCVWAGGTESQFVVTIAARGLEELFFQLCCCVTFSVVTGNSIRCYLLTIPVVPSCLFLVAAGNSFGLHRSVFWLWREIVLGVTNYLSTIPVVPLCQFFGCGGK